MNQFTRDQNQAIQGFGEGISGGLMYANRNRPRTDNTQNLYSNPNMPQYRTYAPYSKNVPTGLGTNQSYETTGYSPYDTDFTFDEFLRRGGN